MEETLPQIALLFPVIVLNQAFVGFIKSYGIFNRSSINTLSIISGLGFTYIYTLAYGLDFNTYELFLIGLVNGLSSIGFYKTSRGNKKEPTLNSK